VAADVVASGSSKRGAAMRKVVMYELLSLDGIAESPNEFILDRDEVMDENFNES